MKWIKRNVDWIALLTMMGTVIGTIVGGIYYASTSYADIQNLKNEVYGISPDNSVRTCLARSEQKIDDIADDVKDIKRCIISGNCK